MKKIELIELKDLVEFEPYWKMLQADSIVTIICSGLFKKDNSTKLYINLVLIC